MQKMEAANVVKLVIKIAGCLKCADHRVSRPPFLDRVELERPVIAALRPAFAWRRGAAAAYGKPLSGQVFNPTYAARVRVLCCRHCVTAHKTTAHNRRRKPWR